MEELFENLINEVKNHDKTIIMAHKNVDMDGLSSSIGLAKLFHLFNCNSYVFKPISKDKNILKSLKELETNKVEINFINKDDLIKFDKETTLLIVVDTHKKSMIEYSKILEKVKDVVVLDHHVKGNDAIEETVLTYINSNMSSMDDLITDFYQRANKDINPTVATLMLAGMSIDTNNFRIKMSPNTYLNASKLLSSGAEFKTVMELLQEDKNEYIKRSNYIENSYSFNKKFIICPLDEKIQTKKILAQISDTMLEFNDVEASFTIGYIDNDTIGISARSTGDVDVQKIMQHFNGGGHFTDAACQIDNTTINEVEKSLKEILEVIE